MTGRTRYCRYTATAAAEYSRGVLGGATRLSPHFRVHEIACSDGSDRFLVHPALLVLLEDIRSHFGAPVTVNSGYRSPSYNAKIGGARRSRHVMGLAADIRVRGATPDEVAAYAEALGVGGLGRYRTFTHVDIAGAGRRWNG